MKYEYFCLMRNMLLINKQFLIIMYNPNYDPKYTYFHYTILNRKSLSHHFSKKKKSNSLSLLSILPNLSLPKMNNGIKAFGQKMLPQLMINGYFVRKSKETVTKIMLSHEKAHFAPKTTTTTKGNNKFRHAKILSLHTQTHTLTHIRVK